MIICSQCGNKLAEDLRFCTECGAETPMFAATMVPDPGPPATIPYGRAPETAAYKSPQHPQPPQPPQQQPSQQPQSPQQHQQPSQQQPPPPQYPQPPQRPPYVLPVPTPRSPEKSSKNTVVWVVLSLGVLVLVAIVVVGIKLSLSHSNDANNNTNRGANLSSPPPGTPYTGGRVVICKYNGVNVRDAPNNQAAGKVAVINIGQEVRIIRESPNRDSVFIPSRKETVEDNWSEVQFEMLGTSYHGWIFSGFLR